MNIKKPNSFARYGNDYVAPLTTIDQIVKPSGERYTDKEFELMSNVENVMFGENSAGKNLLNPTLQTTTKNGVTCTNNGDGTYTVNGTVSDNELFDIGTVYLKKGTYKINGRPNNYGGFVWIGTSNRGADILNAGIDENGATFTITNDCMLYVTFIFGQNTYNNAIIKPMITDDLTATYDDFEPYVKSLRQLTDSALNMDLLWTNASPNSTFPIQYLSLNLKPYKALIFITKGYCENDGASKNGSFQYNLFLKPVELTTHSYHITHGVNGLVYERYGDFNDTRILITDAYQGDIISNENLIPIRIYGVK